jgi:hypothetical protein
MKACFTSPATFWLRQSGRRRTGWFWMKGAAIFSRLGHCGQRGRGILERGQFADDVGTPAKLQDEPDPLVPRLISQGCIKVP